MTAEHLRVRIVADLLEEKWPSMDLVADMLCAVLPIVDPAIEPRLIRPPMIRRAGSPGRSSGPRFTFDRALNRFYDLPRLVRHSEAADVTHVVDHSYGHLVHSLRPEVTVVTCHDLDAFRSIFQPEAEPRPFWFRKLMANVLDGVLKARRIVFDTDTVRREFISRTSIDPGRTAVIPLGVHPSCSPEKGDQDGLALAMYSKDGADTVNLIHVGSTIPRKRIEHLLTVFSILANSIPNVRLVRVGGPFTSTQRELAARLGILDRITVTPFIEPPLLAALYRNADLLLLPSAAEGFGLPMLEAMACGTLPVVADLPVLREVGGDAALFIEDDSPAGWASAISQMLSEKGSAAWDLRLERCLQHAASFTWRGVAQAYSEVYRSLFSSSRSGEAAIQH